MAAKSFRSLYDVSAALRGRLPAGDLSSAFQAAFHLQPGAVEARRRGDALELKPRDKTIQFALAGLEPQILSWLEQRGVDGVGRVTWSAE